MDTTLMEGEFNKEETLDLITRWVHLAIKYHELKIGLGCEKEERTQHELAIQQLQKDLFMAQQYINEIEQRQRLQVLLNLTSA